MNWQPPPQHTLQLMEQHGYGFHTPALHLFVVLTLLDSDSRRREQQVESAREFFRLKAVLVPRGIETLPAPWLEALPTILWQSRRPHWDKLPYMLNHVTFCEGILDLGFAQELPPEGSGRVTAYDRLRVRVNAALYPSRYQPLQPPEARRLAARWPELLASLADEIYAPKSK